MKNHPIGHRRTTAQVMGGTALVLLAAFSLAGCGSSDSSSGSGKTGKVKLAASPNASALAIAIADKKGIFEKNGLDVSINKIDNQQLMPAAIASNQYNFSNITPPLFLNAVLQHLPVVAAAGGNMENKDDPQFGLMVPEKSPVKSLGDLGGRKVATPTVGGNLSQCLQWHINQKGLKPAHLVAVPFTNMKSQLSAGQVDAALLQTPQTAAMTKSGYRMIEDPCLSIGTPQQTSFQMANSQWAKQNPNAVKAMQKSLEEAAAWAGKNPDETLKILSDWTGQPAADVAAFEMPQVVGVPPTADDLGNWSEALTTLGAMKSKPDLSDAIFKG
ncbi:ABC transporter substrate-binding protein [Streptomyces sp. NPDC050560]|uniref:ABC transporter substrate-binding protein n=1 Tax=Streptomyces sp. NPDC050560 TaxID=3365630 RepID=UPI0037AE6778